MHLLNIQCHTLLTNAGISRLERVGLGSHVSFQDASFETTGISRGEGFEVKSANKIFRKRKILRNLGMQFAAMHLKHLERSKKTDGTGGAPGLYFFKASPPIIVCHNNC